MNHIIIVMRENHSFDNYFGALAYGKDSPYTPASQGGGCAADDHSCVDGLHRTRDGDAYDCADANDGGYVQDPATQGFSASGPPTPVHAFHDSQYCATKPGSFPRPTAPPGLPWDVRVAWWRVGILAVVTVAAGTGAWIEFTQAGRTPVASRSSALPTPRGPNPGDLRALFAASPASPSPSPAPTPVPGVGAAPRRSTATDRRASRSPRTSSAGGNPFHGIPGAGPIEDLCRTGCGR